MMKAAKMKTVKAWALVWDNGDMYGDAGDLLETKREALKMLRAHGKEKCAGGEYVERIARVEIREVSK